MVYAVQGTLKRQSLFPKWGAEPQSQRTPNRGSDLGHRNSIVAVELCSLLNNKNTLRVCSAYNKQPNQYTRGKSLKSTIDFHQLCSLPPPKKKKKHLPFHMTGSSAPKQKNVHPWKLTCTQKRDYCSREYILQPVIFRGDVSFRGVPPEFCFCSLAGKTPPKGPFWSRSPDAHNRTFHKPPDRCCGLEGMGDPLGETPGCEPPERQ